ncbi:MAG: class I SAM-dependent methyltransferase [Woeseiaceae bacterium]|nr:class I SAM-dependent methyltransferase [Woeseiaceae bacterium]
MTARDPACPCCGSGEAAQIGKLPDINLFAGVHLDGALDGGYLYRCRRCHLKFRHPLLSADAYAALYDNEETSSWPADEARPDWERITSYLDRHRSGGRVLDFGCYTGGLLARLGAGYERFGVEINKSAARLASQHADCPVWTSLAGIPPDRRFDIIVTCDVVEHVENPADTIGQLLRYLEDDGILVITTGDGDNRLFNRYGANWWYCFYPEHIAFISKPWLDARGPGTGFRVEHVENFYYCEIGTLERPLHLALTVFYGRLPRTYLALRRAFDRLRGRPGITSVTGVGVTDDHLLIVLAKAATTADLR